MSNLLEKPEILAPAGSFEHFMAAVENGADAVYFGGKAFNARAYADNFEYDEMKSGISYAHDRGVRAYMTLNTLIKASELKAALSQAEEGISAGIDAVIVQDLGLAALLKKHFPELPLHMSTQATVYDRSGLEFAEELGFKRAVLARELSLKEIEDCCTVKGIEKEVFVHGALCMCLSGQCSMSALIGDRSGNRGSCAQPCRKYYSLEDKDGRLIGNPGYLLSPKDISYLGELGGLIRAGVHSLKIEGRMKTPEYTALTVSMFRKYLDRAFSAFSGKADADYKPQSVTVEPDDSRSLTQMFCRGSFTGGHLHGRLNAALLSGDSPKHRGLFLGIVKAVKPSRKNRDKFIIEIELKQRLKTGDGVEIITRGFPGGVVSYIRGKSGAVKAADAGELVSIGDIPGRINPGDFVYKVTDSELMKEIRKTYKAKASGAALRQDLKIPVRGRFIAAEGRPVSYSVFCSSDGQHTFTSEHQTAAEGTLVIEAARTSAITEEQVLKQLKKTGNTPFDLTACEIILKGELMIPVSEINQVRRRAMEGLQKELGI